MLSLMGDIRSKVSSYDSMLYLVELIHKLVNLLF